MDLLLTDPSGSEEGECFSSPCPSPAKEVKKSHLLNEVPIQNKQLSAKAGDADDDELRDLRRVQIERQALRLVPSISTRLLAHMSSFEEALQIAAPLNVAEWNSLRPALIAERDEAVAKLKVANKLRVPGAPLEALIEKKLKDYFFDFWRSQWRHVYIVPQQDRSQFATGAL